MDRLSATKSVCHVHFEVDTTRLSPRMDTRLGSTHPLSNACVKRADSLPPTTVYSQMQLHDSLNRMREDAAILDKKVKLVSVCVVRMRARTTAVVTRRSAWERDCRVACGFSSSRREGFS